MIYALNMELEIVRTVFRSKASEASVYADRKRDTGSYYTVLSIYSKTVSKEIAERMALSGLFSSNSDFIGSFTHKDALHLVFRYHPESRLAGKESLYASSFAKRKELALGFLSALAETELPSDIGRFLITDENVNIAPDGSIFLNYFLDFTGYTPDYGEEEYYRDAARYAFRLLASEYAAKYEEQMDRYPDELRLMYKKTVNRAFKSLSQIISFVLAMPDAPQERHHGVRKILGVAQRCKRFVVKNSMMLFVTAMIAVTVVYLGVQIGSRVIAGRNRRENTVYVGMQTIGEVYLGEEDI